METPSISNIISNFNKMVSTEDELLNDKGILRINQVNIGEYFSGIVYVIKTTKRRNRDGSSYDITFNCIDGDGVKFVMRMFGYENGKEFDLNKEIILIKQGQAVASSYGNQSVFYNVNSIVRYKNVKISLNEFIKEIGELSLLKEEYKTHIKRISNSKLLEILSTINSSYNIKDILSTSQYSKVMGTSIGSPMWIYNKMIDTYLTFNNITDKDDKDRFDLFNLTTVLYVLTKSLTSNSDLVSEELKEALSIDEGVMNPFVKYILNSNISERNKSVILYTLTTGLNEYKTNRLFKPTNTLSVEFFRLLLFVESKLLLIETSRGVTGTTLYDGTYLI